MKTSQLNEKFKKATKAQKRVMIAQDVLDQIRAKRYRAVTGKWVDPIWKRDSKSQKIKFTPNHSAKDAFENKAIDYCKVCALGGLFMSCTNLNNHTTIEDLDTEAHIDLGDRIEFNWKISNGLNKIFSQKQLKLIESFFEGGEGYFQSHEGDNYNEEKGIFYESYSNYKRLEIIMQNIIDNDGTFKPNKLKI